MHSVDTTVRAHQIRTSSSPSVAAKKDLIVLFASRMARLFGCGLFAVVLALYLDGLGFSGQQIGLLLTLTFVGDGIISLWLATRADRVGRRLTLKIGAILMTLGGAGMAVTDNFFLLVIAATIGVISPTGAEVGPFLAIEQACVAQLVKPGSRTRAFAWYHVAGFTMSALGALTGGLLATALQRQGWSSTSSYRVLFWLFAICGVLLYFLTLALGPEVEASAASPAKAPGLSESLLHRALGLGTVRPLVLKLSALFALDSFGGGFCVQSFLAWWCHQKFGATDAQLGTLFFGANLLSGFSALAAVPIAARFGLVNTMVWTHLPSSVLLMGVPLMPTFTGAAILLWLRNCISQMDVPTRTSYVNAIVPTDFRSAANGVTTTAKQLGTSLAPLIAAPLIASVAWMSVPFYLCGSCKITYDLLLWRSFRKIKPPEEQR